MDWEHPKLLLLALPLLVALLWIEQGSVHPMGMARRRILLIARALGVLLALIALAGPARVEPANSRAVVAILDHSQSLGEAGLRDVFAKAKALREHSASDVQWSYVALGDEPAALPAEQALELTPERLAWQREHGGQTDAQGAIELAQALFPAGSARHIVLLSDGHETRGSITQAAREAAVSGITLHTIAIAGPRRPDARVVGLTPSRSRVHEGAGVALTAELEATMDVPSTSGAALRLFENGIEVERKPVSLRAGEISKVVFTRSPPVRDIYKYRAVLESIPGDELPANNDALALVDVRGRLRLLLCEGEPVEATYLSKAMEAEGIALEVRDAKGAPKTVAELGGYDAVILSDVAARQVGDAAMAAIHEYVDKLGGGLVMLGGPSSFGVGGYHRTPIEELLPVRLRSPDEEEKQSSALAIVMDRSGSMMGEKIETAKSAAVAAAEVLGRNDSLGVYAFDSEARTVSPMARVTSVASVAGQISTLTAGGGTFLEPAMKMAREALQRAKARVRHMIVLTDGQTTGEGYENLAASCRSDGMTISTVAIGEGSHVGLLQAIAAAGGGQAYSTNDVASITRIFTEDTLMHTGRMIREEPFDAVMAEPHPMLAGFEKWSDSAPDNAMRPPALLGYVRTLRKANAQVPLVTDTGDPLLAHCRFGLGKVTAFTSDAKSRWASLWISRWPSYPRFWGQVLRETARPPQGQRMDLRVSSTGASASVAVDLLSDASTRANDAQVVAQVFFVAADTLGAPLKPVANLALRQSGPGLYEGSFRPDEPGVYLVRAQAGAEMVSAGLVHNPSSEASLGTTRDKLLADAAAITGGTLLKPESVGLNLTTSQAVQHTELWPRLVLALIFVFLLDVLVRRWENVMAWAAAARG